MAETWNYYIQRFFAVIQQQRCCSNPWSNAKKVQFYHQKENDMLKLGCTLPNLANICLHKSNNEKFYPFCKIDRDLRQKIREDMTDGPSIVFSRKAVVDKIFIRDSSKICKSIVWIYESQFYPYSMCQDMTTWLYTRWEFHSDMQKFNARYTPSRSFENMVLSYYQETKLECRIESFHTSGNQKKIDCFNVDWYCDYCKTVFEALGCYYHFYLHRRLVPHLARKSLIEEKWERWMTWDVSAIAKKITKSKRCGNVSGGKTSKRTKKVRIISDPTFPTKDLSLLIFHWEKKRWISLWLYFVWLSCSRWTESKDF